jgi:hypothetical protein
MQEETIQQLWPETRQTRNLTSNIEAGNSLYFAIQAMSPKDEAQRFLKTQVMSMAVDLAQVRALLVVQSTPSVSKPMLVVVVSWLVVIFLSFSLLSTSNATANLALVISAVSVAAAILLILELDRPFGGMLRISSDPMVNALKQGAQ